MTDPRARDAGFSLMEVVVSMVIMSVVGAVFTTAIVQVYRATTTIDTMAQAQTQVRLALQRLDRQIRYAYDVTEPTTPEEAAANAGTWAVEFLRMDTTAGTQECDQLRLKGGVLSLRRWTPGATPPAAGTALASGIDMTAFATVSSATAVVPFDRQDAGSTPLASPPAGSPTVGASYSPDFQRLRVRFVTVAGQRRMASDVTFTALNTSRTNDTTDSQPTADVCRTQGRP